MKPLTMFFSISCLLLLATLSYANSNSGSDAEHLIMRVQPAENKAVHITLANLQHVTTNLTLKALDGKVYYHDTIRKHNGYGKSLSLHNMPKGRYLLTVSQGDTQWNSVIVIGQDEIKVSRVVAD